MRSGGPAGDFCNEAQTVQVQSISGGLRNEAQAVEVQNIAGDFCNKMQAAQAQSTSDNFCNKMQAAQAQSISDNFIALISVMTVIHRRFIAHSAIGGSAGFDASRFMYFLKCITTEH